MRLGAVGPGAHVLSCIQRPGIIAAVSQFLGGRGANILECDQHTTETDGGLFVMRIEFRRDTGDADQRAFEEAFAAEIAEPFAMTGGSRPPPGASGWPRALHADLSSELLNAVRTPMIKFHHSFVPAFAGADPYAPAHERGVKIIGATAHYRAEELDGGLPLRRGEQEAAPGRSGSPALRSATAVSKSLAKPREHGRS